MEITQKLFSERRETANALCDIYVAVVTRQIIPFIYDMASDTITVIFIAHPYDRADLYEPAINGRSQYGGLNDDPKLNNGELMMTLDGSYSHKNI
jgi:hypothetical protein